MSHKEISPVQVMVLGYMREFFAENDQLPPAQVISNRFGWNSVANARWHVRKLERHGYIEPNATGKYRFKREAA
jgi:SOS-response transcriptional repressor LexA